MREVANYPDFCNPLHVAVQSSGKLQLILDLSHLNSIVVKQVRRFVMCASNVPSEMFNFCFDLKSAYHHVDICTEHTKFLSLNGLPGMAK